jgi:hypothetical protein
MWCPRSRRGLALSLRWSEGKPLRILDFDTECRPLSYIGSEWTSAEITAIAASWADRKHVKVWLLELGKDVEAMLREFATWYDAADCVTGHAIRRHDLPLLSGAMLEYGLPPLKAKLTIDTYSDLRKRKDLSASQESLGRMYGLGWPKEHMSQPEWREANRLTPEGLKHTKRRVAGDVRQHKELRLKLQQTRMLKAPRVWVP